MKRFDTLFLVQETEKPKRNLVSHAIFYIICHDVGILQSSYLLFPFVLPSYFKGVFSINQEIAGF